MLFSLVTLSQVDKPNIEIFLTYAFFPWFVKFPLFENRLRETFPIIDRLVYFINKGRVQHIFPSRAIFSWCEVNITEIRHTREKKTIYDVPDSDSNKINTEYPNQRRIPSEQKRTHSNPGGQECPVLLITPRHEVLIRKASII